MTTCDLPDVEEWCEDVENDDINNSPKIDRRFSLEAQILLRNGIFKLYTVIYS